MQAHPSINLPQSLSLWPEGKRPLASPEDGPFPRFTYYLPSEEYRSGQSVLILPGGGYGLVSTAKEGHRPAQFLSAHGIAAGVLEYRHAPSRFPVPLLDAQRGVRWLRHLATTLGLRQDRVGVMGFSAGGHLAGMTATLPGHAAGLGIDELDGIPARPDFAVLVYPVVTFGQKTSHHGSCLNLLGDPPPMAKVAQLSLENAVTAQTPPMLLIHGQADGVVPPENSLVLYAALTARQIPATLHLYEGDGHGFGLGANHRWGEDLLHWLAKHR